VVAVKDEKVAAACEFVLGCAQFPSLPAGMTRNFDRLRAYILKHDSQTYFDLID